TSPPARVSPCTRPCDKSIRGGTAEIRSRMAAVDTFELLPSLASGDLAETSAPELVAGVFRSRASGTLLLETREGVELRMFFRAGEMCGAGAFDGFQTLAHVLLANDWVNARDIEAS